MWAISPALDSGDNERCRRSAAESAEEADRKVQQEDHQSDSLSKTGETLPADNAPTKVQIAH